MRNEDGPRASSKLLKLWVVGNNIHRIFSNDVRSMRMERNCHSRREKKTEKGPWTDSPCPEEQGVIEEDAVSPGNKVSISVRPYPDDYTG